MSVSVNYTTNITTNETIDTNVPAAQASKAVVIHDAFNTATTLTSSTTPPATLAAYFEQALTAGAATIDLTSLTGTNNLSIDGTGLKVQAFRFKNQAGNAAITLVVGASNGYDLLGAATSVTLAAGQEIVIFGNDATPDVAAGDKELDISGTGTEICEITIVLG